MPKLPKLAVAYAAAIGSNSRTVMASFTHKGEIRGGRLGRAKEPNFQIECPNGTVLHYRVRNERAEIRGFATPFAPVNLSDPLNEVLKPTGDRKCKPKKN